MRKFFSYIAIFTVVILMSGFSAHAISAKKAMLWELKDSDSTIYLLGSVHVWKKDLYPLYASINQAYEKSDDLTVEVNLNALQQDEVKALVRKEGIYPPGITILDYLSIQQTRDLERKLKAKNMSLASLQQLKPWLLSTQVTQAHLAKLGYLPEYGVDQYFLNKARATKPIMQLETLAEQIDIIAAVYEGLLKIDPDLLVDETSLDSGYLQLLMATWKMGRYDKLYSLLVDETMRSHPAARPAFNKLFDERNKKFTKKIIAMLDDDKTHFVIIGAGHFGGKGGIISLLEKSNYTLRQIETTSL